MKIPPHLLGCIINYVFAVVAEEVRKLAETLRVHARTLTDLLSMFKLEYEGEISQTRNKNTKRLPEGSL